MQKCEYLHFSTAFTSGHGGVMSINLDEKIDLDWISKNICHKIVEFTIEENPFGSVLLRSHSIDYFLVKNAAQDYLGSIGWEAYSCYLQKVNEDTYSTHIEFIRMIEWVWEALETDQINNKTQKLLDKRAILVGTRFLISGL